MIKLIIFIPILLFSKAVKLEEILSGENQIKLDFSTKYYENNKFKFYLFLFYFKGG
jgi:hypothetical protein